MIRSAIGSKSSRRASALASAAAIVLIAAPAVAQPSAADRALAESLFEQGRTLLSAKRYTEACPKFEESQRLDPGGGTLLNLAACHEAQGRTATAWADFKEALAVARKEGRSDREEFALTHIKALEPKLSHLTITVPHEAEAPGLVVAQDGTPLGRAAWGAPFPVDAGAHTIVASAPGYQPWQEVVTVPPDAGTGSVTVQKLVVDASVGVAPAAKSGRRTVGYVVGAFGVVGLGVGAAFGVSAISLRQQSDAICSTATCPPSKSDAVDLNNSAKTSAIGSDIAFGVGIAALATGAVLVVTGRSSDAAAPAVAFVPGPGGASFVGTW